MPEFRLLVIADAHHGRRSAAYSDEESRRRRDYGAEFVRRAIEDARRRGGFDAVALMGDMVDDANPEGTQRYKAEFGEALATVTSKSVPVLAVRGNHDPLHLEIDGVKGYEGAFYHVVTGKDGVRCRFFVFRDDWTENDVCTRKPEDLARFAQVVKGDSSDPLIVLQHNPMGTVIDSKYPYMLTNQQDVMREYSRAGVSLCICGHYHRGQPLTRIDDVSYFTTPAITQRPHPYAIVKIGPNSEVAVDRHDLIDQNLSGLVDVHCHTEFAYCGVDISTCNAIERAKWFGLHKLCLTEHAPQLYCTATDFWQARHVREPAVWRSHEHSRMSAFREFVSVPRCDPMIRVGLEVELDCEGNLTLHDEDRQFADLLLGAIHYMPMDHALLSDSQVQNLFMETCEKLILGGVHVLAHPWRWFRKTRKASPPTHLYRQLASMLAEHGVVAEINYHINEPDVEFFAECISMGVKIALGTDSHENWEMANLGRNVRLLQQAAGTEDISHLLYDPD